MRSLQTYSAKLRTPFAVLGIRTANGAVTGIEYLPAGERAAAPTDAVARRAVRELESYLADPRHSLRLAARAARHAVPAARLGRARGDPASASRAPTARSRAWLRTAPRAVGQACGANPIALVIPCHRVVGSQGSLGGFMNADDGDPLADQALAADARRLSLRRLTLLRRCPRIPPS